MARCELSDEARRENRGKESLRQLQCQSLIKEGLKPEVPFHCAGEPTENEVALWVARAYPQITVRNDHTWWFVGETGFNTEDMKMLIATILNNNHLWKYSYKFLSGVVKLMSFYVTETEL